MLTVIVAAFKSLADEYRGQVGEDIRLQKSHQYLDKINENREGDGDGRKAPAHAAAQVTEDKDQRDQANDDDVAGDHVGEQPHNERDGLGKDAQHFHRDHDGLYAARHGRIENMTPVMTVGAQHDHQE